MWFWLAYIISETFLFLYILVTYVLSHNTYLSKVSAVHLFLSLFFQPKKIPLAFDYLNYSPFLHHSFYKSVSLIISIIILQIFLQEPSKHLLLKYISYPFPLLKVPKILFYSFLYTISMSQKF